MNFGEQLRLRLGSMSDPTSSVVFPDTPLLNGSNGFVPLGDFSNISPLFITSGTSDLSNQITDSAIVENNGAFIGDVIFYPTTPGTYFYVSATNSAKQGQINVV